MGAAFSKRQEMSSIVIFLDRSQNKLYPVTERKGNEEEKALDSFNRCRDALYSPTLRVRMPDVLQKAILAISLFAPELAEQKESWSLLSKLIFPSGFAALVFNVYGLMDI
ncbi:hypothetical protein P5673_027575 [Acropora cervicornis]|uniref:Uncharacterized protein n=1 Tax=Acropora cervicornis TaxID=6130 RepID=A0AAD9PYW1_ACRCE|nr:hypothetical protein P5673_027575 [Acropora cervicornis]